ncbi:MAG: AMP-dependent synthetase/ligase [Acidimicrobiia bacterium]|nr:MAG: AMP-dependent synthetase/ligase [Acidimicrobiia bacterium]
MKMYTTPGGVTVPPNVNVVQQLMVRADAAPDHPALAYRDGDRFTNVSTREFWATVRELAAGLVAAGINKGDRVALHTGTRIEFTYFDYAIWAAGAATTTIYETSSAEQVRWIISDSGSVALISENEATLAAYDDVKADLPDCTNVFVIEDGAVDTLKGMATDESREEVDRRIAAIAHSDLATLVYTSGTTGNPKGCVLTHYNFAWEVTNLEGSIAEFATPAHRTLMFLPLAHIFARAVQSVCVAKGTTIFYSSGIPSLLEELPMAKPSWVFSVPRVFEKIYNGAKAKADVDGKGAIFDKAAAIAIAYSQGIERGKVTVGTKLAHTVFDKLVYTKIRALFGGEVKYAISGGAALGARLGHFFRGVGIVVLEGYGLTETTAGSTLNQPKAIRVGTVGRPIQGVSIRIADDGEVLIKGGMVFSGYWNNEQATSEALDSDAWFHSGDIGVLDDEGFLSITGRKKEIIVTAAGKNVAPAVLEDRMRSHALVSQVMVVGDAKPFIAALVTMDAEALPAWVAANGKEGLSPDQLRDDDDLFAAVQESVDYANKAVSKAEAIKTFRILPEDLSIEGGELTPTLKVKRSVVASKYAAVIDEIYG